MINYWSTIGYEAIKIPLIIEELNRTNISKYYDVKFRKESQSLIAEYKYTIGDMSLILRDNTDCIDYKSIEKFITNTYKKIDALAQLWTYDSKEVIETLEYITQNFRSIGLPNNHWYIDRNLILHLWENNVPIKEGTEIMNRFFLKK